MEKSIGPQDTTCADTIENLPAGSSVAVKKKRGRPKKVPSHPEVHENAERKKSPKKKEVIEEVILPQDMTRSDTVENLPAGSSVAVKKKRGRPTKVPSHPEVHENAEREKSPKKKDVTKDTTRSDTVENRPAGSPVAVKKKRGRHKKVLSHPEVHENAERKKSPKKKEVIKDTTRSDTVENRPTGSPVAVKKKRGRPMTVPSHPDVNENAEQKKSLKKKEVIVTCAICGALFNSWTRLLHHGMTVHFVLISKQHPEGRAERPELAIMLKSLKKLCCPRCRKPHTNIQYFLHHKEWCGREGEMSTCGQCNKTFKAMWSVQHKSQCKITFQKDAMLAAMAAASEPPSERQPNTDNPSGKRKAALKARDWVKKSLNGLDGEDDDNESPKKKRRQDGAWEASKCDEDDLKADEDADKESSGEEEDDNDSDHHDSNGGDSDEDDLHCNEESLDDTANKCVSDPVMLHKLVSHQLEEQWRSLTRRVLPPCDPLTANEIREGTHGPLDGENINPIECRIQEKQEEGGRKALIRTTTLLLPPSRVSSVGEKSKAMLMNPGSGPVASDWLYSDIERQWLILSRGPPFSLRLPGDCTEGKGLLDVWEFTSLLNEDSDAATPELKLRLTHNYGCIRQLRSCPILSTRCSQSAETPKNTETQSDGSQSQDRSEPSNSEQIPNSVSLIGHMAMACEDCRIRIVCIPDPDNLYVAWRSKGPLVLALVCKLELYMPDDPVPPMMCQAVDWQHYAQDKDGWKVAAGFHQGNIGVWHLTKSSMLSKITEEGVVQLRPYFRTLGHTRVENLRWLPNSQRLFVTSGRDRVLKVWDAYAMRGPPVAIYEDTIRITRLADVGPANSVLTLDEPYLFGCTWLRLIELITKETKFSLPLRMEDSKIDATCSILTASWNKWTGEVTTGWQHGKVFSITMVPLSRNTRSRKSSSVRETHPNNKVMFQLQKNGPPGGRASKGGIRDTVEESAGGPSYSLFLGGGTMKKKELKYIGVDNPDGVLKVLANPNKRSCRWHFSVTTSGLCVINLLPEVK